MDSALIRAIEESVWEIVSYENCASLGPSGGAVSSGLLRNRHQGYMSGRVLIVEDDPDLRRIVCEQVRSLGFSVDEASDGNIALEKALANDYELIVLDLNLPRLDGNEVCQRIRERGKSSLILMLTARADEVDRVLGLELGADDYLTKPFSVRELVARVKALMRRAPSRTGAESEPQGELNFGDLKIDLEKRRVLLKGERVGFTSMEFELLALLASHPGKPFTRAQIVESVWRSTITGYEGSVTTMITRIRSKIEEDPANPVYLLTVRGVGYAFRDRD